MPRQLTIFSFISLLLIFTADAHQKLKVHLFYESLCPACKNFVKDQLVPNYDSLAEYIDVVLIPFGKSTYNGDGTFDCQHGVDECRLNKIQSCALNFLKSARAQIQYVGCQENPEAEKTGEECIVEAGLDWSRVEKCRDGNAGLELQIAAMREQERVIGYPKYVPNVVVDEKPDPDLGQRLIDDFKGTICELLNNKPDTCKSTYTVILVD